jgi:hypothetical protein
MLATPCISSHHYFFCSAAIPSFFLFYPCTLFSGYPSSYSSFIVDWFAAQRISSKSSGSRHYFSHSFNFSIVTLFLYILGLSFGLFFVLRCFYYSWQNISSHLVHGPGNPSNTIVAHVIQLTVSYSNLLVNSSFRHNSMV